MAFELLLKWDFQKHPQCEATHQSANLEFLELLNALHFLYVEFLRLKPTDIISSSVFFNMFLFFTTAKRSSVLCMENGPSVCTWSTLLP